MRWPALTALLWSFRSADAMYAHEAGKIDWHTPNIGPWSDVRFGVDFSLVASKSTKVTGFIDNADGSLKWRRVFSESDPLYVSLPTARGMLTVTGSNAVVHLWDHTDGSLLWDVATCNGCKFGEAEAPISAAFTPTGTAYVVSGNSLTAMELRSGRTVWKWTANDDEAMLKAVGGGDSKVVLTQVFALGEGGAAVVGYSMKAKGDKVEQFVVLEFAAAKGAPKITTAKAGRYSIPVTSPSAVLFASIGSDKDQWAAVALSGAGTSLVVSDASSGSVKELDITSALGGEHAKTATVLSASGSSIVHLSGTDVSAVVSISASNISIGDTCDVGADCVVTGVQDKKGNVWTAKAYRKKGHDDMITVELKAIDSEDRKTWQLPLAHKERGNLAALHVQILSDERLSIIVQSADDSAAFFSLKHSNTDQSCSGELVWVREEGLASLTSIGFVDAARDELVEAAATGAVEHHIPTFAERLKLQWADITMALTGVAEKAGSKGVQVEVGKDDFGLSKLAIAITKSGKLCAIQTSNGKLAWSNMVGEGHHTIYITRPRPVLGYAPEFALVTSYADSSLVQWFDGLSGIKTDEQPTSMEGPGALKKVISLETHDEEGRQILMLVNSANEVTFAPSTPAALAKVTPLLSSMYHHNIGPGGLETYIVVTDTEKPLQKPLHSLLIGSALWPGETVLCTTYPQRHEVVASQAVVLGNDSLLLKYLNPHMVVVVTAAAKESSDGTKPRKGSDLTIWLLDTVSGRVLYRLSHAHGSGPVNCAVSENNVVCSHWNAEASRTEVTSLSLFEGMVGAYNLGPMRKPARSATFSSFVEPPPIVIHKTYIMPHTVSAMGLPVTAHGITAKDLLVAFEGGHILSLDKRLLDPRRPTGELSKADKAERLVPYQPFLPVTRTSVITHGIAVERVASITTASTTLESTSLLLASGLDLFCTRVAPSKTFDMLSSTFNYQLMLLIVGGLFAGTTVVRNMAKKKKLETVWA